MTVEQAEKLGLDFESARKVAFATSRNLKEALAVAWGGPDKSGFYCHYTTLPKLLSLVCSGEWWLRRSSSQRFNDLQETKKFGKSRIAEQTFQVSFGKGVRESVALWQLYAPNDPFAVKVLIPAEQVVQWIEHCKGAELKDIIYTSIPSRRDQNVYDKKRGGTITWNGVSCNFQKDKKQSYGLSKELMDEKYTGGFKDHEWAYEDETRLCICHPLEKGEFLRVPVPGDLIERMTFTLSPWLKDEQFDEIKSTLIGALRINRSRVKGKVRKEWGRRFHRSVLSGALNFRKISPVKCPGIVTCQFGMLLKGDGKKKGAYK